MRPILRLIAWIFACTLSINSAAAQTLPHRFVVTIRTPEGLHKFELSPSTNNSLYAADYIPLKGKRISSLARSSKSSPIVAGGLIARQMNLVFWGKRRARLYELKASLERSGHRLVLRKTELNHVASTFSVGCGIGHSQPVGASHLPGSEFIPQPAIFSSAVYSPVRYIGISTDADFEFHRVYPTRAKAVIRNILNIAEAIYLDQLGFGFQLLEQSEFKSSKQPYKSNDSLALLQEFQEYSEQAGHLGAADIKHLFTAKDISNGVIGLAYVGAACEDASYSYGLTKKVSSAIQALVTAHEIGHSLGATHPENTFPFAPPSLMTSLVKAENNTFSNFSLTEISQHIDSSDPNKTCLTESKTATLTLNTAFSSASTSSRFRFSANLAANNLPSSNCTLSLYASTKGRLLESDQLLADQPTPLRKLIYQSSARKKVTLHATVKKGRFPQQKRVFFRAALQCSDPTLHAFSDRQMELLSAYGTKGRLRDILELLSEALP